MHKEVEESRRKWKKVEKIEEIFGDYQKGEEMKRKLKKVEEIKRI